MIFICFYYLVSKYDLIRGLLTWLNEDDRMNITKICECDRKLTTTNILLVNLTKIWNKNCHNHEHCLLNMTKNRKYNNYHHNGKHEVVNMTKNKNKPRFLVLVYSTMTFGHLHSVKLTSHSYSFLKFVYLFTIFIYLTRDS